MTYGFIGTGNMGTTLIYAFISSGAIPPQKMMIYNRTRSKAEKIAREYNDMLIASSLDSLIKSCETIFICVRPSDYPTILKIIRQYGRISQTYVSITSSVMIQDLEKCIPGKVIKIIPSITNAALSGAMLVMYGTQLAQQDKENWNDLFSSISSPVEIDERFVRISSDLTSCGPAFISFLLQNLIDHAVSQTGISRELATHLVAEMMIGYGKLFAVGKFTLDTLQEQVIVPGGVTGVGLDVLKKEIGPLFAHLFQKTHEKFEQDVMESKEWITHLYSST